MSNTYQLTSHPVGSKWEMWTLSWPLMVGLISSSFMMFIDRLFLAQFDPLALNAAATAGIAYYIFLVIPMGIVAISEVLVGRLHGEGQNHEIGSATWQMVWFGVFLTPVFWMIGGIFPDFLFAGTGNEIFETAYFNTMIKFAPVQCATIALLGFFVGTGNVKIVTLSAILGNVINIVLDYVLIFGWGPFPEWGVMGAAFATGVSLLVQFIFLLCLFWARTNREAYKTHRIRINPSYLFEGLRIGTPSSVGHCLEVIAHFIFFRIVMSVGSEHMTIVAIVQSFYILSSFVVEAQSKAASAIVSNLLGAQVEGLFGKVLCSSFILHSLYFLVFFGSLCVFPDFFFQLFASPSHKELLADPYMAKMFWSSLFYMCLFFLFDGFCWILIGFLTAAGDTRYVFWVSTVVNWLAYVLPTLWLVGWEKGGADVAWGIVASMSFLNFVLYAVRYLSGNWLKQYRPIPA